MTERSSRFVIARRAFAGAIKELRGKRSQREVATRAGIDEGAWSAYEKGTRWPRSMERLKRIAIGLQVDLDDLERLMAEHHGRQWETEKQGLEVGSPQPKVPEEVAVKDPLAEERTQVCISETIGRITSDLIQLVELLVARQVEDRFERERRAGGFDRGVREN